ncbi:hypothetical protein ACFXD5_06830 [Streptomyces sp. NPDC059385]|uniref:DUF6197 family protein n=1 Tax=Streptomyces sp. NPDC059385 TaxID=3346817 RepID=UPI0036CF5C77
MNRKPSPTDLLHGSRRTVLVALPVRPAAPTTVEGTLLAAARLLQKRGLWQGDYVPDALDREMCIPHTLRPMSVLAAIKCVVSGNPHRDSLLADNAIGVLAVAIDDGPYYGDIFSLEAHVEKWNDEPGRTVDEAVALLERVATSPAERAA